MKKNIVAVGREMATILNQNGIPTIHCQIMHDKDSYNDAYTYSAATIKKYLKQLMFKNYLKRAKLIFLKNMSKISNSLMMMGI